jgi:hypothetical protein
MKKMLLYRGASGWERENATPDITITTDGVVENVVRKVDNIIDLLNSHSEAIEKLKYQIGENAALWEMGLNAISRMQDKVYREPTDDTHRTVTLRIPKDMTVCKALFNIYYNKDTSDTDLQAAIDKIGERDE